MKFLEFNECTLVLVLGYLSCGRSVDSSLYDVENASTSSFVTESEQPFINEIRQPTLLEITIDDLQETNKKIFVIFTLSKQKSNSVEPREQNLRYRSPVSDVPIRSVFDVLMAQHTHYPAAKSDPKKGDGRQRNAVVSYICDQKFVDKGIVLEDFGNLVTKFCSLLREIDPRYYKLKARGCSFPDLIEKLFLGLITRSHMATK